jgi:photosystem II stability/assembly factor-like uncharacterized protein
MNIHSRRVRAYLPRLVVAILLLGGSATVAVGQVPTADIDSAVISALEWREIGPAKMGGRVADLAVLEGSPATFYVGLATGGVWRTTSHGASWEPLFDEQETASIGDVTLAPSNPNVIWVGTGEPQNRQSSPWGNGVYRSMDGGKTWSHLGLEETRHISRIAVHPRDPDVAYVAAVGHLWGPNPERGVYRTRDGGQTWELVLHVDDDTGAIDLAMDPGDPNTLFAAMYQRRRTNFGFNGGGPGGGIHRTVDGGDSWDRLSTGLPKGDLGRIGLDVYRRDGNTVYAIIEARGDDQGVYRSLDRGETWEKRGDYNPRPMYYSQLRIDPNDPQRVYSLGTRLAVSEDGGKTFDRMNTRGVHVDHHAMWIDPDDSKHLILGNDGGIYASFDRGQTWHTYNNLAIGQFYEIGIGMDDPYTVCGGLQDNGSWCGPSANYNGQGVLNGHWREINGGDGFYTEIDPTDPAIVFAEFQGGFLARVNLEWGEGAFIRPVDRVVDDEEEAEEADEDEEEELERLRWNWNSPIVMSAHDPRTIYFGANVLFKSGDRGQTWEEISPDLTKNIDRRELEIMGRQLTDTLFSRNDGISSYGNMTTIAESPLNADLLYAGTDDGNIQRTQDGGVTWTDLTANVPGVPDQTYVSRIAASRFSQGRVYLTFDGHTNDDYAPYAFVSEDYGDSWRPIVAGLPQTSVNVIAEDLENPNLLFLGNEVGVFFTTDGGNSWRQLKGNLPTVSVDDMELHPREKDLVIGTHGRSIWILHDLTPLQELTPEVLASAAHLFPPKPARSVNRSDWEATPAGRFVAPNPPNGAVIRYYLGQDAAAETGDDSDETDEAAALKLSIVDSNGNTVRELDAASTTGLHEAVWDLRIEPPYEPERGQGGGGGFFGGGPQGPKVLPGTYTVRLEAGGMTREASLTVELDPRIDVSRSELAARQEALMDLYALAKPTYEAGRALNRIEERLEEVESLLEGREETPDAVTSALESLQEAHEDLEEDLDDVAEDTGMLGWFMGMPTSPPTADNLWMLERAWERAPDLVDRVNELVQVRMPELNSLLDQHGIRPDPGKTVDPPERPDR